MNLSALVWPMLGVALLCLHIIIAPALAEPGAMSAEGEETIWWARLLWVVGIVVVFGLFLLAVCWLRFYWLPKWRRDKP